MDERNIERINQELLERTGVDFSRYRNPELIETIGNAIVFPRFLAQSLRLPAGLMLIMLAAAFLLTDSGYFRGFLLFPGVLLAILNGVLLGLVLFVYRIRGDMKKIFAISSDLTVQALQDVRSARLRLANRPGHFPGMLEIFQGINATVVLPAVVGTLKGRIPLVGRLAARITERFFSVADRRLAALIGKQAESPDTAAAPPEPVEAEAWLTRAEAAIRSAQGQIARVVDAVSRVVAFPFILVFAIVFALSAALTYAFHAFTH